MSRCEPRLMNFEAVFTIETCFLTECFVKNNIFLQATTLNVYKNDEETFDYTEDKAFGKYLMLLLSLQKI